jgi:hypothetical protein
MFMDRCGNGNVANPVAERSVGGTGGSSCLHLLELAEPEQRSGTLAIPTMSIKYSEVMAIRIPRPCRSLIPEHGDQIGAKRRWASASSTALR